MINAVASQKRKAGVWSWRVGGVVAQLNLSWQTRVPFVGCADALIVLAEPAARGARCLVFFLHLQFRSTVGLGRIFQQL